MDDDFPMGADEDKYPTGTTDGDTGTIEALESDESADLPRRTTSGRLFEALGTRNQERPSPLHAERNAKQNDPCGPFCSAVITRDRRG